MASSDRFPVPVRWSVKSNLAAWCCQNLHNRALNALPQTVQASTTELGKQFQIQDRLWCERGVRDAVPKSQTPTHGVIASSAHYSLYTYTNIVNIRCYSYQVRP